MAEQLPAYLRNRQAPAVAARALQGLGSSLPPHISIRGNQFTLVDSAGAEAPMGVQLDCAIIDISEVMCKRYYDKPFDPKAEGEPPTCWSANGIAPSREAIEPQSPTCAACPNNVRGSATSAMSGKAIKACRDEKWLAILIPKYPEMLFQLILSPGSFTNWKAFSKPFDGQAVDISDVVTRISFEPKTNGVLLFQAMQYIEEATHAAREKALLGKATDVLVGRNDVPIQGALIAPKDLPEAAHMAPGRIEHVPQENSFSAGAASPAFGAAVTNVQPNVNLAPTFGGGTQAGLPFGSAQTAGPAFGQPSDTATSATPSPSDGRRKRRTRAEIDAANAAASQPQGAPAASAGPAVAPFRPQPMANGPAAGPAFGIGPGVSPNQEMTDTINSIFK